MLSRRDPNLKVVGAVIGAKHVRREQMWRGLDMGPGAAFTIPDARRFVNLRTFPAECGWMVETSGDLEVKIAFCDSATGAELGARRYSGEFQPMLLPWPHAVAGPLDLTVSVSGSVSGSAGGSVFVANHRALSRQWLYDAAVGTGVEIGPGPNPQIRPRDGVAVSYLEQMPPEEWNRLYNRSGKFPVRPELWANYIIGEASDLPVADGSLDFIFTSHVFEHLANPIGHLRRWKRKLAPGGKVISIIPDLAATSDAQRQRSTIDEICEEEAADIWLPQAKHYARHFGRPLDDAKVRAAVEAQPSIHAHFYDNINCQMLLDLAVRHLGYDDYVIEHTPNHKDFHFILRNA